MKTFIIKAFFFMAMIIPLIIIIIILSTHKQIYCEYKTFPITPLPLIEPINFPQHGLITLWFDSTYLSQDWDAALNLMDQHNLKGTISVTTGNVCKRNHVTWDQLHVLQNKGWEITSRSIGHDCTKLKNDENIIEEILNSKQALNSRGFRSDNFVLPCESNQCVSNKMARYARDYYLSTRGMKKGLNFLPLTNLDSFKVVTISYNTSEKELKKWINFTYKKNGWLILVFHQIDQAQLSFHADLKKFKFVLDYIGYNNIPIVLPIQVINLGSYSVY